MDKFVRMNWARNSGLLLRLCDTTSMESPLLTSTHPSLADIPKAAERRIALHVSREAERALRAGHPWLFESSIERQSHAGKPGDLAVAFDQKRRFLAIGLYDPTSPLRLRVLQHGLAARIDQAWFVAQL